MNDKLTILTDLARVITPSAFVINYDEHGDEIVPSVGKKYRQAKALCKAADVIMEISYMSPDVLLKALDKDEIAKMQDTIADLGDIDESFLRHVEDLNTKAAR